MAVFKLRRRRKALKKPKRPKGALLGLPADYSPAWLERIEAAQFRAVVSGVYRRIVSEQDLGSGISVLRDLLIRRVVRFDVELTRIEVLLDDLDVAFKKQTAPAKRVQLLRHQKELVKHYAQTAQAMAYTVSALGIDAKGPIRTVPRARAAAKPRDSGKPAWRRAPVEI